MNRIGIVAVISCLLMGAFFAGPAWAQEAQEKAEPQEKAAIDKVEEAGAGDGAQGETKEEEECEECPGAWKGRNIPKTLTGAITLLAGVAVLVLSGFSLFAFLLLIAIVFPGTVGKVRDGMEGRPVFSFLLGFVNVLFALLLIGALANGGGAGGVLSVLILLAFLMLIVFGLSGRAQNLGSRAMVLADRKPNAVANLAIGWWVLFLVGIIPIVGWVLFAYWATSGVGAVLVSILGKSRKAEPPVQDGGPRVDKPNYVV